MTPESAAAAENAAYQMLRDALGPEEADRLRANAATIRADRERHAALQADLDETRSTLGPGLTAARERVIEMENRLRAAEAERAAALAALEFARIDVQQRRAALRDQTTSIIEAMQAGTRRPLVQNWGTPAWHRPETPEAISVEESRARGEVIARE
jgi:hypothetical protein